MERYMEVLRAYLTACHRRGSARAPATCSAPAPSEPLPTTRAALRRRLQAGFTALELMIVVAIVAILAGVALPMYSDYIRRGKVAEATSVLGNGRVTLEQYFLDNRTYVNGPCPASTASFTVSCGTGAGAPSATAYTITATGNSDVSGFVYTVNQANAKTTAGPWVSGTQNCWVVRKGDTC
jgi:type IV pilus assembly protein PilE